MINGIKRTAPRNRGLRDLTVMDCILLGWPTGLPNFDRLMARLKPSDRNQFLGPWT